jgi:serine/threonine kinase PknH
MTVTTMQTRPVLVGMHPSVDTVDWPAVHAWPQGAWGAPDPRARDTSRRTWALIGAGAAALVSVAVVVALLAGGGSAASPAAGPAVANDALSGLLLDEVAVNKAMHARYMAVDPALTLTTLYDAATSDKPECGGVSANANRGVYAGSGWGSAQTRFLREPSGTVEHEVAESVIGFSSAEAAANFVAAEAKKWPVCNGRYVTTASPKGDPQTRWVSTVAEQNGMLTATSVQEGGRAWGCQHALTARNNVVVDVQACGSNVTQQGAAIAKALADRVQ